MNIVFASSLYQPNVVGGAEKVFQTLGESLARLGHTAVVVTTQPRGDRAVEELNGVRIHYVPTRNLYRPFTRAQPNGLMRAAWHAIDTYNPMMGGVLGRILDEERPDVVNTHNLAGLSVAAIIEASRRTLPLVHTLHDQYLLCPRVTMFKSAENCRQQCFTCSLYAVPRKAASQRVDVAIGVSRFILERHVQHGFFTSADHRVVYNGFATGLATPGPASAPRPFRFGYLGQIRDTKGVHLLVEAFAGESSPEAELWIAGRGDARYEGILRERTTRSDRVRWLGFVDPEELFQAIDVLVVPSVWADTAPLVVIEAFQRGIPVVGSNRGGIPELITADTGWLFDPAEPNGLAVVLKACARMSTEQLRSMAEACRARAREFGLQRFLDGYLDAYAVAIERAARAGQ